MVNAIEAYELNITFLLKEAEAQDIIIQIISLLTTKVICSENFTS